MSPLRPPAVHITNLGLEGPSGDEIAFSPTSRKDPSQNLLLSQWFSNCGPWATVSASPRILLDVVCIVSPSAGLQSRNLRGDTQQSV